MITDIQNFSDDSVEYLNKEIDTLLKQENERNIGKIRNYILNENLDIYELIGLQDYIE